MADDRIPVSSLPLASTVTGAEIAPIVQGGISKRAALSLLVGDTGAAGSDGREVEIQNDGTNIQWRYDGDVSWTNIVALIDLKGDQGDQGIQGITGDDGREIELQNSGTYIQWRYVGDVSWINLVLLDDLKGSDGKSFIWEGTYSGATTYQVDDTVAYNGSSYICILESTGNLPTNTTYWGLMAAKGIDGAGSGDMLKSVYDPTTIEGDSFDMGNMVESATAKVLTDTERSAITANTAKNTYPSADATKVGHLTVTQAVDLDTMETDISANNSKVSYTDATDVGLNTTHRSSDGKNHSDVVLNNAHRVVVTGNPHSVSKSDVSLGNVDNTSDADKPVSTAQQTALDGKVNDTGNESISGIKTFNSSPIVPAPTTDLQVATKKYVDDTSGTASFSVDVNQVTHGLSVGNAIYLSNGSFSKALADDTSTSGVQGVVSAVADVDNFTYDFGGNTGTGYTSGTNYFLSNATAGLISTEPTYTVGDVRVFIGQGQPDGGLLIDIDLGQEITSSAGVDTDAIHNNVGGEIAALTEKTTLVDDDLFIIEDSASSNVKKKVKKSNFISAAGASILDLIGYQSGGWSMSTDVSSAIMSSWGLLDRYSSSADSQALGSSVDYGISLLQNTTSVAGNEVRIRSTGQYFKAAQLPIFSVKFSRQSTADYSLRIGLTDKTVARITSIFDIDNDISLTSVAGDNTLYFSVANGGTTSRTDTGVTLTTQTLIFVCEVVSTTEVNMWLYDDDYSILASTSFSSNIPTGILYFMSGYTTETSSSNSLAQYSANIKLKK